MTTFDKAVLAVVENLRETAEENGDYCTYGRDWVSYRGELYPDRLVRAVLTAVREPDEAMTYSARHALADRDGNIAGPVFTAMIDAILAEGAG